MQNLKTELAQTLYKRLPHYFPSPEKTEGFIEIQNSKLILSIPFVCSSIFNQDGKDILNEFCSQNNLEKELNFNIKSVKGLQPDFVKNVIAVSSGKGGVGKSTTAVNLAISLQREGAKVGILDADIYGPSIPILMGTVNQQPQVLPNDKMQPIVAHNIQTMSIGYLIDGDSANIWRGPMASRAFQQLYEETQWQALDYLIVDMPPGTGDIQLTLAQQLPVCAAIIVTTPQDLALADAIKGIEMYKKVDVPILGMVENMSYHTCSNCLHKENIFGTDGADKIAEKYLTNILQKFPLSAAIRQMGDAGSPLPLNTEGEKKISDLYSDMARNISMQISEFKMHEQQISVVKV